MIHQEKYTKICCLFKGSPSFHFMTFGTLTHPTGQMESQVIFLKKWGNELLEFVSNSTLDLGLYNSYLQATYITGSTDNSRSMSQVIRVTYEIENSKY